MSGIVLIGGSAGSLQVLLRALPQLPPALPLPVVIVLHRRAESSSSLESVLQVHSPLVVKEAEDKEEMKAGIIYVAPSDYHLLIEKNRSFTLDFSEKINFSRPSIDVTFESAADIFGSSVTGILLSGANGDGARGLKMIRRRGGLTAVQDPATALSPYMPQKGLDAGAQRIIAPGEIAGFIAGVAGAS